MLGISSTFLFVVTHEVETKPVFFYNEGTRISALLYFPSEEPKGVVIIIHGYGGRKEALVSLSLALVHQDYLVLAFDLRGHGDSGGTFDLGLAESHDVSKAIDYLETHGYLPEGRFLALFGISFGGSIGIIAGGTDSRVSAVVTVVTIGNLTRWITEEANLPALNRIAYLTLTSESFDALDKRSAVNYAANVSSLLIIHGKLDNLVSVQHAYDLANVAPQATLRILDNADHAVPAPYVINTSLTWFNNMSQGEDFSGLYALDASINLVWLGEWFGMFFLLGGIFLFIGGYFASKNPSEDENTNSSIQTKHFSPLLPVALGSLWYLMVITVIEALQSPPDLIGSSLISRPVLICPILIYIAHKLYSNYSQYQTKDLFKLTQLSRREVYEVLAYAGVFIGAWTLYGLLHGLILLPFSEFFSLLDSPILFIIAWGAVIDEIWFRWLFQGRLLSLTYSPTLRIGISASLFVVVKTSFAVLIMTFWGLPIAHWLPAVVVLFIVIGLSTGILYEYTNGLKTSSALSITTLTLMFASIGSTIFM